MAITNLAYVQTYRAGTVTQARLDAALSFLVGWIGFDPSDTTARTEVTMGTGGRVLHPRATPIISVTSLKVGGAPWTVMSSGGSYTGQHCMIHQSGRWIESFGSNRFTTRAPVELVYSAGEAVVSKDLQDVAALLTHLFAIEPGRIGMSSKSLGPEVLSSLRSNPTEYELVRRTVARYQASY